MIEALRQKTRSAKWKKIAACVVFPPVLSDANAVCVTTGLYSDQFSEYVCLPILVIVLTTCVYGARLYTAERIGNDSLTEKALSGSYVVGVFFVFLFAQLLVGLGIAAALSSVVNR
jgi:hypothetical protein